MGLTLEDLERLYGAKGDRMYAGEPVTQLQHALQSAELAEREGADESLVLAAFLHDVGHLINDQGETPTLRGIDDRHEYVAIPFLRGLFGEAVLQPIRLHVEAKRYLCARGDGRTSGAEYWAGLSADSRRSLELQGGIFSAADADDFIAQAHAADAVRLRQWDDMAKLADASTRPAAHYFALADRLRLR
jgi:phosphonate degradation associated HDIG domain protein